MAGMKPQSNGKATERPCKVVPKKRAFPADDKGMSLFPSVCDCLFVKTDEEGKVISDSGSLSIRPQASFYIVTVTVPYWKAQTSFKTETLVDIMDQVERHLATTTDWQDSWTEVRKMKSRLTRS